MQESYQYQNTLDTSAWDVPRFSADDLNGEGVGRLLGEAFKKKEKKKEPNSADDESLSHRSDAAKKNMRANSQ